MGYLLEQRIHPHQSRPNLLTEGKVRHLAAPLQGPLCTVKAEASRLIVVVLELAVVPRANDI
jgi:hypothetical protein